MVTRNLALTIAGIMLTAHQAGAATPFPVTDQNPLTRGFYHPLPTPARWDLHEDGNQFLISVANTTNMNSGPGERMLVDTESTELRWLWSESLDTNWRIRASVPVVHYGGGVLDPLIDGFHRMLGLPQGSRPRRPDDQMAIEYSGHGDSIRLDESFTGIGDMSIELGRSLINGRELSLSAWTGIELPTGDSEHLTGNGAFDAGVWFSGEWRPRSHLSLAATLGGTHQGSGELLNAQRANWVGFQNVVARWDCSDQFYLQAQIDTHDAYVRSSDIPLLGASTVLTFGGGYRTLKGWRMGLSVSEDLKVTASPDVVFQFTIRPPFAVR